MPTKLSAFLGKHGIVFFFLLCAVPTSAPMALLTPAGQVPDEQLHLARAAGLLHGAILAVRKAGTDPYTGQFEQRAGVKVDFGLFLAGSAPVTTIGNRPVVTPQDLQAARAQPPDHRQVYVNLPAISTYFPIAYLPATLALALGLAVKASPFTCFLMARLFMLATFLALGALALSICAYGEAVLLTILLLPMTLFLAGSVSQDAVLIALACLACAALTRNTRPAYLLALTLLAILLTSKPPYILLLAIFLLPNANQTLRRRARAVALASLPVLLWSAAIAAFVVVPYITTFYHPGPLYTGNPNLLLNHANPAINFHILRADPVRILTIPWATLILWGPDLLREMTGVLGLLQLAFPEPYYRLWAACGLSALAGVVLCPRPGSPTPMLNFAVVISMLIAAYWLMMLVFYVNFTDIGATTVGGLQGRYALPLLPFLILAVPAARTRWQIPPLVPALPTILLALFDLGYLPLKIIRFFYLH